MTAASNLTGNWTGSYVYPGRLEPVPFIVEMRDVGGALSGIVTEPVPAYMGSGEVQAVIDGRRDGMSVRFTKIYDSIDRFRHPVRYHGVLDEEGSEISGTWLIKTTWSGGFVMTRPKPVPDAVELEDQVEVTP